MATQASAVTFLSTPGQGYVDGLRFVQFYFGLPLAMVVLCVTAVPAYQRIRVFTAYEYLEQRFDGKTRSLAAGLFLLQRGLAAGITLYAPALVLSVLLGWDVRWTCALLGALAVAYTFSGGGKAVGHAHTLQFLIILAAMALAFALVMRALPAGVGFADALMLAGRSGRLNAVQLHFDPNDRYNLWSGLIGGFFLQLSYFGTDQSQVGRYLSGQSIRESRLGLLFNGLFKIPMQFGILLLGVMVFVFHLFAPSPVFFNPLERDRMANGPLGREWGAIEQRHEGLRELTSKAAAELIAAHRAHDAAAEAAAGDAAGECRAGDARGPRRSRAIRARGRSRRPDQRHQLHLPLVRAARAAGRRDRPRAGGDLRRGHELHLLRAERARPPRPWWTSCVACGRTARPRRPGTACARSGSRASSRSGGRRSRSRSRSTRAGSAR